MLTFGVFKYSEFLPVFAVLWLYGLSLFGYVTFIQAFFSRPTLAAIVGSLLFFLTSFTETVVDDPFMDEHWKLMASLFPSVTIQRCFLCIAELEKQRQGLTAETLSAQVLNYHVSYGLVMLVFFFVFFTTVGVWLTMILPHAAGGFREHPCFCFGVSLRQGSKYRRRGRHHHPDLEKNAIELDDISNFEAISKGKYVSQRQSGNVLKIQNLTKSYNAAIKVVNNLNVEMYGGEIFALLGHNGAGKTTTIKMVIGLLESNSGRMIF